jgi:hypothetical protein
MNQKKITKRIIAIVCLFAILSCLLPFAYFIAFPATDETSKRVTKLPKGIIAEFCYNFNSFERDEKKGFLMDIRWAAPGTFAVSMPSPNFTRCGYILWLPFIKLPEYGFIGLLPKFTFKWDNFCSGDCP